MVGIVTTTPQTRGTRNKSKRTASNWRRRRKERPDAHWWSVVVWY